VITMGLDTVIVAFFVVGTILVVAGTLTMGANNLIKSSYEGYTATTQTTMDRLHTNIEIHDVWPDGEKHVHLTVNTGETKLSNFDLWDIIVVNVENGQASYLSTDQYIITPIEDFVNPRILDPHESIDIELVPEPEFKSGDNLLIKIITENGLSSSVHYSVGG
jgi:flagellar protein FlaF